MLLTHALVVMRLQRLVAPPFDLLVPAAQPRGLPRLDPGRREDEHLSSLLSHDQTRPQPAAPPHQPANISRGTSAETSGFGMFTICEMRRSTTTLIRAYAAGRSSP